MFSGLSRSRLLFLLIFHFVLSISSVIRHTSFQDLTVSSKPPLDILKNTITLALNRWSCRAVQLTPTKQCHCFPLDNNRVGWWGLVVGRADSYKGNFGKVPLPNETNEQTSCWNNIVSSRVELIHREPQNLWETIHQATPQISDQCQLLELKPLGTYATRS